MKYIEDMTQDELYDFCIENGMTDVKKGKSGKGSLTILPEDDEPDWELSEEEWIEFEEEVAQIKRRIAEKDFLKRESIPRDETISGK